MIKRGFLPAPPSIFTIGGGMSIGLNMFMADSRW